MCRSSDSSCNSTDSSLVTVGYQLRFLALLSILHLLIWHARGNAVQSVLLYSWRIWWAIKFGGLVVCYNRQIKIRQNFLLAYIRMVIPYRTAKFKSTNILTIAILGSTAKFNSRHYLWLYNILWLLSTCCWLTNLQHVD